MTSIEWLVNEIKSFGIDTKFINNGIEQAKEMEEQQTEISDEEIEKFADEELGTIRTDFDFGVIQGMKWYREQLKSIK
jgi:hypothetical protein